MEEGTDASRTLHRAAVRGLHVAWPRPLERSLLLRCPIGLWVLLEFEEHVLIRYIGCLAALDLERKRRWIRLIRILRHHVGLRLMADELSASSRGIEVHATHSQCSLSAGGS